jgi:hypothetical protein
MRTSNLNKFEDYLILYCAKNGLRLFARGFFANKKKGLSVISSPMYENIYSFSKNLLLIEQQLIKIANCCN